MSSEFDFAEEAAALRRAAAAALLEAAPPKPRQKMPIVDLISDDGLSLVSTLSVAVYRYRGSFASGRVEFISASIEEITGRTPEEICNTPVENMLLPWLTPHADCGPDYVNFLKGSYAPGKPLKAINRVLTKDGEARWILLVAQPYEELPGGEFVLHGVLVDITDSYETMEARAAEHAREAESERLAGSERILIVSDNILLADDISGGLTNLGYETAPVYCPFEAAALVGEEPFAWDVLITDHTILGVPGTALIAQVRTIRPDIITVLCSEFGIPDARNVIVEGQADACLLKPAEIDALAASIRRLMGSALARN